MNSVARYYWPSIVPAPMGVFDRLELALYAIQKKMHLP